MQLTTHVSIPEAYGLPDVSFSVVTTGRQSAYAAAVEAYAQMVEAGPRPKGAITVRRRRELPWGTLKTDEQHIIDCRAELLALLEKYNAEICTWYPPNPISDGMAAVRMGANDVSVLTEEDMYLERV